MMQENDTPHLLAIWWLLCKTLLVLLFIIEVNETGYFVQSCVLQPSENPRRHARIGPVLSHGTCFCGFHIPGKYEYVPVVGAVPGPRLVGRYIGDRVDWAWDVNRGVDEDMDGQADVQHRSASAFLSHSEISS